MLTALIIFAAEEGAEPSKTLFYVCGGALAVWASWSRRIGIRSARDVPADAERGRAA